MNNNNEEYSSNAGKKLVAIVDDEPDIIELLSLHLTKAGFNTEAFFIGEQLFDFVKNTPPDLILLDLMLPDYDGFEICKRLKNNEETANIPIIMLTAKGEESDKIVGLEIGADDYITKPFSPRELVARVKVVLRRKDREQNKMKNNSQLLGFNDILEIDLEKHEVKVNNIKVDLTLTEFKIIQLLAERKNRACSREKIIDYIGSMEKGIFDRTVDVHIRNLREKLGKAAFLIKNIRGVGYKLETTYID